MGVGKARLGPLVGGPARAITLWPMPAETVAVRRHMFFLLAALAVFMGSIDGTIMVVALPQLTESLHTSCRGSAGR